jgi:hypothetical protein
MLSRNWFLFLVAIGCAWAIGYFMGSSGVDSEGTQHVVAATGENRTGSGAAHQASGMDIAAAADVDSKSIYSFGERISRISNHPSARWRSANLTRLTEEVAITEIPRILEELKPGGSDTPDVTRMLFARWAETDPRGALEFARRTRSTYGESTALGEWAAADPPAAIAWLQALPPGPDRDMLVPSVMPALARVDPARAFEILRENPGEKSGGHHHLEVILRWASKDLPAARTAVEGMRPGYARHSSMAALASGWAKFDPDAALSWALELPDQDARRWVIEAAIRNAENLDIETTTAKAKALPDERDQSALLASLVGVAAKRDPEEALALLGEISTTEMRESATTSVIYAIMRTDIDRAAALAETLAGRSADQPIIEVAERLKFTDPARAAALSLKISSGSSNSPLGGVLTTWLNTSPDAALAWIEKTKLPQNAAWRARDSFARWAGENPSAATALVEARSNSENIKWAVNAAIQGIAAKDPKAAAEMAVSKAAAIIDASALSAIGSNWAQKDPKTGSAWVMSLPQTPQHHSATWGFTNAWAAADPTAAAAWIDRLQPGTTRDSATSAFSGVTARTDPEAALQWAATIQKEGIRNDAMNQVLRTWAEREPAAVKKWIASQPDLPRAVLSNLPP